MTVVEGKAEFTPKFLEDCRKEYKPTQVMIEYNGMWGMQHLREMQLPLHILYPAVLGLTSFGGFCAAAQTQCMVQKAGFPLLPYLMQKLAAALTASLLGILYLFLL